MTVQKLIMDTLGPMGYAVVPDIYEGDDKKYYTYTIADDRGAYFADDLPISNRVSVQIHFFLPIKENYIKERNQTRQLLLHAGFTYPVITMITEPDTQKRHIIFECEVEEEREVN